MSDFLRPLDLLNENKGKRILIKLKDGNRISGVLIAFDININIYINNAYEYLEDKKIGHGAIFIRGDNINFISGAE